MPRNHTPAASTLRNRNRITNKTRLKIHQGSLDADAVLIPDEDEEKHRLTNLVAGVDAEDANEHHLQEVLSAVRNNSRAKPGAEKVAPQPAFIPTPDSTGIVDNYEQLYPANKWKDPLTYVCTSTTVEETVVSGLANGFTYYMDERDKEWLDKNNEEARGEGTSAQGAVSASGTRTSARSAKAKGKEPEASQPSPITEDEFELVMGIFEKVTHERTEYLHHGLETGMDFPAFSEYQDVFSLPLGPSTFATYALPDWIPPPATLLRIAKTAYPYWKERRVERGGHRIIPTLNGDESDTLNESYICFRRRESKAVRKTRASQVTSSDKLARLQVELGFPLEMAQKILQREQQKKIVAIESQKLWVMRQGLVDLKRKFPSFNDKADDELLIDKERPVNKQPKIDGPRMPGTLKIRTGDPVAPPPREMSIKPRERYIAIRDTIENTLARQREADHHWDDQIDNPYQNQPTPYASRLFKYIPPPNAPVWPSSASDKTDEDASPSPLVPRRAIRSRYGRNGRMYLDRRDAVMRSFSERQKRSSLFDLEEQDEDAMDVDEAEQAERDRRLLEQWRYDSDDVPAAGPLGSEEQDRELVDDYDAKYLRHTMSLFQDTDYAHLTTDYSLVVAGPDGRTVSVVPYRTNFGGLIRREHPGMARIQGMAGPGVPNGTPVAMQQQIKKMGPPPQMRISSNGGMRAPAVPMTMASTSATPQISPPHPVPVPVPQHSPSGGANGISRPAISMPHVEQPKNDVIATPAIPPAVVAIAQSQSHQSQPETNGTDLHVNGTTSPRPKPVNPVPQQHVALGVPTNGFHLTPMPNIALSAGAIPHGQNQPHGLSLQQVQNIKTAFANMPASDLAALHNVSRTVSNSYIHANGGNVNMQLAAGANLNLKLPPNARQMQWPMNGQIPRPASVVNGVNGIDGQVNGGMISSPNLNHSIPVRSPSTNGTRPLRNGVLANGQHSVSPRLQHSTLPNISQSQSPPRVPLTPNLGLASPSLQHQQPVGTTQSGY